MKTKNKDLDMYYIISEDNIKQYKSDYKKLKNELMNEINQWNEFHMLSKKMIKFQPLVIMSAVLFGISNIFLNLENVLYNVMMAFIASSSVAFITIVSFIVFDKKYMKKIRTIEKEINELEKIINLEKKNSNIYFNKSINNEKKQITPIIHEYDDKNIDVNQKDLIKIKVREKDNNK